ncbi:hypothetical protein [Neptunomonas japonica]|uniref:hypothetical protein n=1 Tax=Neptunomonas japonica TaxID=417574 RepID=UPI000429E5A9|nr:hypothetical protein [Neptunomonas japonica]
MDWFFPLSNGGEEQGLNESGVQQFKRPESLGRETCQNIGDVRDQSGQPVIAEFELVHLPSDEFPGKDKFIEYFSECRDYVLKGLPNGTGNEKTFFDNGLSILCSKTIPVLRIGDYHTTGLVGQDSERTQPFFRLLKQQGASSSQGVGGGTFGIGQRAPFAHSALRTILYSTKTEKGDRAFIAKSILASFPHPDHNGEITQAKGWWCNPSEDGKEWSAIRDTQSIPRRFQRDTVGTDLWITGFDSQNWEQVIRHSVLEHFFAAIQRKQFIIRFVENGKTIREISSVNLEQELLIAVNESRKLNSKQQHLKGLGSTLYFYKALEFPYQGKPFEKEISKIGKVKFYLYRDVNNQELPERWATMRLPLIMVESKGSTLLSNFAGLFICDNDEGNTYLAQLEGATHESWSEKETRNWSHLAMKEAKGVLRQITSFVRDVLKEVRGANMKEQEDIPNLGRYLPAEDSSESEGLGGSELAGEGTTVETGEKRSREIHQILIPNKVSNRSSLPKKKKGGGSGLNRREVGENKGGGTKRDSTRIKVSSPGIGDEPKENPILSNQNVRFRSFKVEGGYKVVLEAKADLFGDLQLKAIGEGSDFPVELNSADDLGEGRSLQIVANLVKGLELKAGIKTSLLINVDGHTDLCLAMGGA